MIIFTVRMHSMYAVTKCYLPCANCTRYVKFNHKNLQFCLPLLIYYRVTNDEGAYLYLWGG